MAESEEPGILGAREFVAVEMSFAGRAADHQRAQLREARPQAPDRGDQRSRPLAAAGEEILIEDEERLDRPDLAERIPYD